MRMLALTVLCVVCPTLVASAADMAPPWAFKGKPAEGYSIDLVSIDPAPGTVLQTGERVGFKITITYAMSIAEQGRIVLVFQDENNRQLRSGEQVAADVSGHEGKVSLAATVTVPKHAKELRLFVPLIPAGLAATGGELTFRYPVKRAAMKGN